MSITGLLYLELEIFWNRMRNLRSTDMVSLFHLFRGDRPCDGLLTRCLLEQPMFLILDRG